MYTSVKRDELEDILSNGLTEPSEELPPSSVVHHIEETRPPDYPPRENMLTLVPYQMSTDEDQVLLEIDVDQIEGKIWTARVAPLEELELSSPDKPEMLAHRYWDSMILWKPSRNIGTSHEVVVDGRIPPDAITVSHQK
ncbi:hypothetical protein EKH57_17480 (plasmid) [Halorubrum sp. BOL3-1]|uniref:hypothetical protein n=1 Tax=Halorubrum sp. BOL3-1 TaxID=2497325 RepID=UPI001005233A|nr:hypothetical protein [Halorubrum sp. BOL3-1]QAU14476.1 hypothetical protein EKH57_17480 [Halorubrum sp. BOL3-1]